jgi:protein SDA1
LTVFPQSHQILTPADFALLDDLRIKAAATAAENGGGSAAKRKLAQLEAAKKSNANSGLISESFLDEGDIMGPRKKQKQDYEERMASIQKGREGREKYGARKDKRATQSSSTNREKARNKPIMMHLQ